MQFMHSPDDTRSMSLRFIPMLHFDVHSLQFPQFFLVFLIEKGLSLLMMLKYAPTGQRYLQKNLSMKNDPINIRARSPAAIIHPSASVPNAFPLMSDTILPNSAHGSAASGYDIICSPHTKTANTASMMYFTALSSVSLPRLIYFGEFFLCARNRGNLYIKSSVLPNAHIHPQKNRPATAVTTVADARSMISGIIPRIVPCP
jgi:hypothetical protein